MVNVLVCCSVPLQFSPPNGMGDATPGRVRVPSTVNTVPTDDWRKVVLPSWNRSSLSIVSTGVRVPWTVAVPDGTSGIDIDTVVAPKVTVAGWSKSRSSTMSLLPGSPAHTVRKASLPNSSLEKPLNSAVPSGVARSKQPASCVWSVSLNGALAAAPPTVANRSIAAPRIARTRRIESLPARGSVRGTIDASHTLSEWLGRRRVQADVGTRSPWS